MQSGTFIYKPGISVTKQDFHLQMGSLGLQMGFSGYYLPFASKYKLYLPTEEELREEIETQKAIFYLQQKDAEEEAGGEPNA